jgi:hypothetical protein
VSSDYLVLSNVRAAPYSSTWYAGTNSTNSGTYGWIYTVAPVGGSGFFLMF